MMMTLMFAAALTCTELAGKFAPSRVMRGEDPTVQRIYEAGGSMSGVTWEVEGRRFALFTVDPGGEEAAMGLPGWGSWTSPTFKIVGKCMAGFVDSTMSPVEQTMVYVTPSEKV